MSFSPISSRLPFRKRFRRITALLAAISCSAVGAVGALSASAAAPAQTIFVNQAFTGATAGPNYLLPSAPTGTNAACLTAGTSTSQTPIPGCTSTDPAGSGALRLTAATQNQEGGVGSTESVPISMGIDAVFNTFQYGGSSADGIAFYLAATDPYAPAVPKKIGQAGGSLGYSPSTVSGSPQPGLEYGYLGIGLDVYGNWLNPNVDGTGCTTPATGPSANNVAVRGPGNGTAGYCVLSAKKGAGTLHGTTRTNSRVPVEILINPSSTAAVSSSGSNLAVAANSYLLAYTPIGGTQQTLTGTLPSTKNGLIPTGTYDSSWIDPATGYPYKLTYGWVGSTGGSTDVHEINALTAQTVNGPVPDLQVTSSGDATVARGATGALSITPRIGDNGGSESAPVRVTTTFPTGVTPTAPGDANWACTITGQSESCTYTPGAAVVAGTDLPVLSLPYAVAGSPRAASISYIVASTDTKAVSGAATVNVSRSASAVSATMPSAALGSSATLTATVSPADATGTVTFKDSVTNATLCTATVVGGEASCTATAPAPAGAHTVTADYSGDTLNAPSTTTAVFTVTKAATAITVSALPASGVYGSHPTYQVTGLPAQATGTVTFTIDGTTACTATLPQTSCEDPGIRPAGSYTVTAAYGGDGNYLSSAGSATAEVTQATVTLTATATPATVQFGNVSTLAVSGLPADGAGLVTFTDAAGTELCSVTLPASSCATSTTLAVGAYDVTANYSGDTNHTDATAAAIRFTIVKAPVSIVAVVTPPGSAPYGTSRAFSVTGLPRDATGIITFTDGSGAELCVVAVVDAATCSTDALVPGGYAISAAYSGDGSYLPATATVALTVAVAATVDTHLPPALDDTSLMATWTKVAGAQRYRLLVSKNADFSGAIAGYDLRDVGDVTAYRVTGLAAGTKYFYRAVAIGADGVVLATQDFVAGTKATAPAAPAAQAGLAETGSATAVTSAALAVLLLGVGLLVLLVASRRRRSLE